MATGQLPEAARTPLHGLVAGNEKGSLRGLVYFAGACAADDHEVAGLGHIGFETIEGVDVYGALVKATVGGVGLFGMGKRGSLRSFARRLGRRAGFRLWVEF
ncbi:MAG: hypothetical protein JJT96_17135 [Opitutales bacterium]|nr:hypothetical protein [Opitutales bacterium]